MDRAREASASEMEEVKAKVQGAYDNCPNNQSELRGIPNPNDIVKFRY